MATKTNNFYTYLAINLIIFAGVVLLMKNYLFQALDWLLALININYALYVTAVVSYFIVVFLVKTFLIGSFSNAIRDSEEDSMYLATAVIAMIIYIVLDNMLLASSYPAFSLLV